MSLFFRNVDPLDSSSGYFRDLSLTEALEIVESSKIVEKHRESNHSLEKLEKLERF